MSDLTVPSGDTHTIPEGEIQTYSDVNNAGQLNVGGTLFVGGGVEDNPDQLLDEITPETMDWLLQTTVDSVTTAISNVSEAIGEVPVLFEEELNEYRSQ